MIRNATVVLLAVGMWWVQAAPGASPGIGVATATGHFLLNNTPVTGNATLFDGTAIATERVVSVLRLEDGTRLELAVGSKGTVYRDRLVLERGAGRIENGARFRIETADLAIQPTSSGVARIGLEGAGRVHVDAVSTPVSVTTPGGTLLAALDAGSALAFQTQAAGAAAPFQITGCLRKEGETLLLTDDTAGVTFELRGSDLARFAGKRVEILGVGVHDRQPAAGAVSVVKVSKIRTMSSGCKSPAAAATAGGTAPKAGKKGLGGASKAVIAGVVVASAGAGAAIALNEEETPTISR